MRWQRDVVGRRRRLRDRPGVGSLGKACRGFWHDPSVARLSQRHPCPLRRARDGPRSLPLRRGRPDRAVDGTRTGRGRRTRCPVDGANEYPVLTGILMWLPSARLRRPGHLPARVGGAARAVRAGDGVAPRPGAGRRALLWSASPILVLYAFHNWDLAVVAASVDGVVVLVAGKTGRRRRLLRGRRGLEALPAALPPPAGARRTPRGRSAGRGARAGGRGRNVRPDQPSVRPSSALPDGRSPIVSSRSAGPITTASGACSPRPSTWTCRRSTRGHTVAMFVVFGGA